MTEAEKIKIEPDFNHALAAWQNGKPLEAIKILQKLDKENPEQPAILGTIAGIFHALEDWRKCLLYSEKAVKLSPKSEPVSIMFFHSLWNHKHYDEAFEEAERFIKLNGFSKEYDFILKEMDDNKETT